MKPMLVAAAIAASLVGTPAWAAAFDSGNSLFTNCTAPRGRVHPAWDVPWVYSRCCGHDGGGTL
jgi:hypothetical protein